MNTLSSSNRGTAAFSLKAAPIEVERFDMVRGGRVAVKVVERRKPKTGVRVQQTEITINDKWQHTFSEFSRYSKALDHSSPEELQERLNGGSYFLINDQLIDLRDRQSNPFIHDDKTITQMIDLIGVRAVPTRDRKALALRTVSGSLALSGIYGTSPIEIPEYLMGGKFESRLMYNWNPFVKDIYGVIELIRLICANGMVGVTDFLKTKFPLVNRWQEHMNIAALQIQNKVNDRATARFREMGTEPSTVRELVLVSQHVLERMSGKISEEDGEKTDAMTQRLSDMYKVLHPRFHLGDTYKEGAYSDMNVASRLPGHLSTFDLYNVVTELYTHTVEAQGSTGFALQRLANDLVFDSSRKRTQRLASRSAVTIDAAFDNAQQAFTAQMRPIQ